MDFGDKKEEEKPNAFTLFYVDMIINMEYNLKDLDKGMDGFMEFLEKKILIRDDTPPNVKIIKEGDEEVYYFYNQDGIWERDVGCKFVFETIFRSLDRRIDELLGQ